MKYLKDFKKLCTPASVYLFINVIIFIVIAIQNFGNTTKYCVGQYKCKVPNTFSMFLFKAVYILFWTFILNAICKAGYKEVSWFMVLLPIILLFIIIGIIILNSGPISIFEGMEGNTNADATPNDTILTAKTIIDDDKKISALKQTEEGDLTAGVNYAVMEKALQKSGKLTPELRKELEHLQLVAMKNANKVSKNRASTVMDEDNDLTSYVRYEEKEEAKRKKAGN